MAKEPEEQSEEVQTITGQLTAFRVLYVPFSEATPINQTND